MDIPFLSDGFRGSAPYIDAHRGKTFVIYVEGDAFKDVACDRLVQDIALLHTLGVRLVLVFGCRAQARQALFDAGRTRRLHAGRWVVDSEDMALIAEQAQRLRLLIEAHFSMGLPNTPLHGLDIATVSGNFVMARPFGIHDGIDTLYAGDVRHIRHDAIRTLLDQNAITLISPIGYSSTGELFDLEATEVAEHVAIALQADKLIMLGRDTGLTDTNGHLLRQMMPEAAEAVVTHPEQQRYLKAACAAARRGVDRTHLLSWVDKDALLAELFTRDGVGTMITQQTYEVLRGAGSEDIGGLLALLRPLEARQILVPRTRERLEQQIDDYVVIVRDGMTIGCAALHTFENATIGELACVAVHDDYRRGKRGSRLLEAIENKAVEQGVDALFILTTHTSHWFVEHGFVPADVEVLPMQRRATYNPQRNSKIMVKSLKRLAASISLVKGH